MARRLSGNAGGRVAARSASVSATATGAIHVIVRDFGSSSVVSLLAGTDGDLSVTGGVVSTAAALGIGGAKVARVREAADGLAQEYPLTLIGTPPPPSFVVAPSISGTLQVGGTGNFSYGTASYGAVIGAGAARLRKADGDGNFLDYASAAAGSFVWSEPGFYRLRVPLSGSLVYAESAIVTVAAAAIGVLAAPVLTPNSPNGPGTRPFEYDYLYPNAAIGDVAFLEVANNANFTNKRVERQILFNDGIGAGRLGWALLGNLDGGPVFAREIVKRKKVSGFGVVEMGDSVTVQASGYAQSTVDANPGQTFTKVAASGRQLKLNTGYNNLEDHNQEVADLMAAVHFIYIGTNGVHDYPGATHQDAANNFIADLLEECGLLKGLRPGVPIAVATLLPIQAAGYDGHNERRALINPMIRAAKGGGLVDEVIDWAADPTIGVDTAPNDGTLWNPDKLHPSGAHAIMGTYWKPKIEAMLADADLWLDNGVYSNVLSDTLPAGVANTAWDGASGGNAALSTDHRAITGTSTTPPSCARNSRDIAPTTDPASKIYFEISPTSVGGGHNAFGLGPAGTDMVGGGFSNAIVLFWGVGGGTYCTGTGAGDYFGPPSGDFTGQRIGCEITLTPLAANKIRFSREGVFGASMDMPYASAYRVLGYLAQGNAMTFATPRYMPGDCVELDTTSVYP